MEMYSEKNNIYYREETDDYGDRFMNAASSGEYIHDSDNNWKDLGGGVRRKLLAFDGSLTMGKTAFDAGARGDANSYPHIQYFYVERGEFVITIDGRSERLVSGDSFLVPQDKLYDAIAVKAGTLIDVYSQERKEVSKSGRDVEQRKHQRYSARPGDVSHPEYRCRDISESGMKLESSQMVRPGQTFKIVLGMLNKPVQVTCKVMWCRESASIYESSYNMGVRFEDLSVSNQLELRRTMSKRISTQH